MDYDITKAPLPIGQVLTGTFITFLLASTFAVYLFFLVDRHMYKKSFLAGFDWYLRLFDGLSTAIMRISASVFFISLWIWHLKFGLIDAIGHLMIIATLFVLVVRGPTEAREMLVLLDKSVWTEAYFMTGLYFLALVMIFILYYGLHHIAYGV